MGELVLHCLFLLSSTSGSFPLANMLPTDPLTAEPGLSVTYTAADGEPLCDLLLPPGPSGCPEVHNGTL